jgi:hypothetical protein
LHFDDTLLDDSNLNDIVIPQANILSIASLTALSSVRVVANANITSTASVSATISHIEGADIIVQSFATLTADVQKLKIVNSQQSVNSTLTAEFNKLVPIDSAMSVVASQAVTAQRTRDVPSSLQANVTLTTFDVLFNFGSAALSSQFAQTTNIERTRDVVANITDAFQAYITARADIDDSVSLSAESSLAVNYLRIRNNNAAVSSNATLTSNAVKTASVASSLASQFTCEPITTGTISASANLNSQFALQSIIGKIEQFDSNQSTTSTLTATAANLILLGGNITAQAQLSASGLRIYQGVIQTDAVFSELFVVVKIGSVVTACDVVASVSATPRFDFSGFANLSANATLTSADNRTRDVNVAMTSNFSLSADGTTDILGSANLTSQFTCAPNVNITASGQVVNISEFIVGCETQINRRFASLVMSAGTMSVSISRTRPFVANLPAISIELVLADIVKDGAAALTARSTLTAVVRAVHIDDIVYKIPRETNLWTIEGETGLWSIDGETRIYVINRR